MQFNFRPYFLIGVIFSLVTFRMHAQEKESRWLAGTGITYCSFVNNPGVNLNVTYRLIGNLHLGPDFSAILNKEVRENGVEVTRKEFEYNFNAQYLFEWQNKIAVYPLTGINFSKITIHPENTDADKRWVTALNLGAGVEVRMKKTRLFFEWKHVTRIAKYDLTAGVIFQIKTKKAE